MINDVVWRKCVKGMLAVGDVFEVNGDGTKWRVVEVAPDGESAGLRVFTGAVTKALSLENRAMNRRERRAAARTARRPSPLASPRATA